jgi:hypothetical protein
MNSQGNKTPQSKRKKKRDRDKINKTSQLKQNQKKSCCPYFPKLLYLFETRYKDERSLSIEIYLSGRGDKMQRNHY